MIAEIEELFSSQLSEWDLVRENYASLDKVLIRSIGFDGFSVKIQFNPARIVSSGAKTDPVSVAQRQCFLCGANRPAVQKGIEWRSMDGRRAYDLLVNPFPIFKRHLTIPAREHTPQSLADRMPDMLALSRALPGYAVFYNGPRCGASAPDHMHFQACGMTDMPVVGDYFRFRDSWRLRHLGSVGQARIAAVAGYLREVCCIDSPGAESALSAFEAVCGEMMEDQSAEPMMNVVSLFCEERYLLFVFPRKAFRPWQYSADASRRMLVSPAAVEMAGLVVTPRKEDFDRIDADTVADIYSQVSKQADK